MKIQVLGTGCPKCAKLYENALAAVQATGSTHTVEKVTDIAAIMAAGVMLTPALVIDGNVKASGKVPTPAEIQHWLN